MKNHLIAGSITFITAGMAVFMIMNPIVTMCIMAVLIFIGLLFGLYITILDKLSGNMDG